MIQNNTYKALVLGIIVLVSSCTSDTGSERNTVVTIKGDKFYINNQITYEGRVWNGYPIEGLLLNSRIVNGIFDDLNPETRGLWAYPDTKEWDPERNTREFVEHMEDWNENGLLAFTINPQGGSPIAYGNKDWLNAGYMEDGSLRPAYMERLEKILDRADELNMVVILGLFYFGQDEVLRDEQAVITAVDNMMDWLFERNYRNILIEINNESDVTHEYDHEILKPDRVTELIERVKSKKMNGFSFLTGTSFLDVPTPEVIRASDFVLVHGNYLDDPDQITQKIETIRNTEGYRPMPVLFTEDDHHGFEEPLNNFTAAVMSYASWGYWDWRREGESFENGLTLPPVDYRISSDRKKAYFNLLKEISGY